MSRPFHEVLSEIRNGEILLELTEQFADLVKSVLIEGKKGELNLKLVVVPNAKGGIIVVDEIKVKEPIPVPSSTIFYADESGGITRRNPNQMDLPLTRPDAMRHRESELVRNP
jgi:hypothetical protein